MSTIAVNRKNGAQNRGTDVFTNLGPLKEERSPSTGQPGVRARGRGEHQRPLDREL